jgi:hypothetical protein
VVLIDLGGVIAVDDLEGLGEGGGGLRNDDEVDVVGHEAVSPDLEALGAGAVAEPDEVALVVVGSEEDQLGAVTALGDVVGEAGDDDPCVSGHRGMIEQSRGEYKRDRHQKVK